MKTTKREWGVLAIYGAYVACIAMILYEAM